MRRRITQGCTAASHGDLTEIHERILALESFCNALREVVGANLGTSAPPEDEDEPLTEEAMMRSIADIHKPGAPQPVAGFTGEYRSVDARHMRYGMVGDRWLIVTLNGDRSMGGMEIEDKEGRRTPVAFAEGE